MCDAVLLQAGTEKPGDGNSNPYFCIQQAIAQMISPAAGRITQLLGHLLMGKTRWMQLQKGALKPPLDRTSEEVGSFLECCMHCYQLNLS